MSTDRQAKNKEGSLKNQLQRRRLSGLAEQNKDLAYRLYGVCDYQKWAEEALGYKALVASWPEIQRYAAEAAQETQARLD